MTPINHLPFIRKPRERLQIQGVTSLELEDLLALIIRTGSVKRDVLSVSQEVVSYLLSGRDSLAELANIEGIGKVKAGEIVAALNLNSALGQRASKKLLSSAEEIHAACSDLLEKPQEHLVAFYLTVRSREIARETISIGTATASLVHPREVFRPAIVHNASYLVLAHNHPSGSAAPSQADLEATRNLAVAGQQIGIELLDHVICAATTFTSLRAENPGLFS